jgi:hypothetical protein
VRAVTVRHVGITVALALLAPLIAHQIDSSIQTSQERAVAALLDAPSSPARKVEARPGLANGVDASDPRGAVQRSSSATARASLQGHRRLRRVRRPDRRDGGARRQ